jgi:hypothetical protein
MSKSGLDDRSIEDGHLHDLDRKTMGLTDESIRVHGMVQCTVPVYKVSILETAAFKTGRACMEQVRCAA